MAEARRPKTDQATLPGEVQARQRQHKGTSIADGRHDDTGRDRCDQFSSICPQASISPDVVNDTPATRLTHPYTPTP